MATQGKRVQLAGSVRKLPSGSKLLAGADGARRIEIIVGVHGLDNRPIAQPHFRMHPRKKKRASARRAADGTLAVTDVARLYDYPSGLTGKGQCIALIELNKMDTAGHVHGTGFRSSD